MLLPLRMAASTTSHAAMPPKPMQMPCALLWDPVLSCELRMACLGMLRKACCSSAAPAQP